MQKLPKILNTEVKIITTYNPITEHGNEMYIGYVSYSSSRLYACIGDRVDVEHQLELQCHALLNKFSFV